ncbi:MAG: BTAD domain-containing putative transcriptional regulator [Stellaceae bacterium]
MSNISYLTGTVSTISRKPGESAGTSKIYLVGRMRAAAPGGEDILPRARKTRGLLACLCLARGERVSRSRLTGLLWDRSGDAQARMSLRHALSELNNVVNGRVPGLIEIGRESVCLDARACWIDAFAAPDHAERLLEDLDGISPSFDHWLASERVQFEDRLRATLEKELNRLIEDNAAPDLRAAAARRLINFDPTHEGAVRSLITAFVQMGDRPQAIREFERCRIALRTMLDLPPSKETVALYEAMRLMSQTRGAGPNRSQRASLEMDEPGEPRDPIETPASDIAHGHRQQPSIAVLPFRNLSAEAGHDYAADGLVEDLIEALSRVPSFFVISRLSILAFRSLDRLPQEIGEVLGVRYVLSGSMRIVGDHLRLTVELTDTPTGTALWVSKLDEQFFDLLEVQNRLAEAIVARVAPYLHAAELKRARVKRPERLDAYDLFLRAQENMHNSSRAVFESSEHMFDEAIARDPHYAAALAWRAYWHVLRVGQGWSPDPARDTAQAEQFARRAVDCDALEPMAFAVQGHIASYLHRDFDLAFQHFETALRINPNAAPAWLWSAATHAYTGNGPRAVEEINRAMALSPYDPLMYAYSAIAGVAYFADGQYERAVECGLRSLRENRTYTTAYKLLIAALVLAGRELEARLQAHQLLKLEPGFTVENFRRRSPGSAAPHGELYCDAFARAGVPLLS